MLNLDHKIPIYVVSFLAYFQRLHLVKCMHRKGFAYLIIYIVTLLHCVLSQLQNPNTSPRPDVRPPDNPVHSEIAVHASDLEDIGEESDNGQNCGHIECQTEIFSACTNPECNVLLCYGHFVDFKCDWHHTGVRHHHHGPSTRRVFG